jgi:hypothetical protein
MCLVEALDNGGRLAMLRECWKDVGEMGYGGILAKILKKNEGDLQG